MAKWWHTLASVGGAVLIAVTPALQGAISSKPVLSTVLGFAWAILGHILPSPAPQIFQK
jgi:hypothetical protein